MFRYEVNAVTGEVKQVFLTAEELAAAQVASAQELLAQAQRLTEEKKRIAVQALIDELLLKRAAEVDAPQAIKDYATEVAI